ncbi:MAG TPA: glucose-1-phosphate cytidylyltransferase [Gemmatimonadaceae bacterium]|nr:glucose-1-phosphate cytidylyltransferase [Gemmatimonadaceae bacterium]
MKVVIFCGGLGMRLREAGDDIPKPMVPIGHRPILWHLMKYYAHYGHKDFILCLGHRADAIKRFFLNYEETGSNDFVLSNGGRQIDLMNRDISDWRITFADTGVNANIGERLLAVRRYLRDDEMFLANYADGLTDMHLPTVVERFKREGKIGNFVSVRPNLSFHAVSVRPDGSVAEIKPVMQTDLRINTGFFLFRREIFDYITPGEELVREPFDRLIAAGQLFAHSYDGFTMSMDTFKDKQHFEELWSKGRAPWEVWRSDSSTSDDLVVREQAANGNGAAAPVNSPVKYGGGDFLSLVDRMPGAIATPANS